MSKENLDQLWEALKNPKTSKETFDELVRRVKELKQLNK